MKSKQLDQELLKIVNIVCSHPYAIVVLHNNMITSLRHLHECFFVDITFVPSVPTSIKHKTFISQLIIRRYEELFFALQCIIYVASLDKHTQPDEGGHISAASCQTSERSREASKLICFDSLRDSPLTRRRRSDPRRRGQQGTLACLLGQ